MAVIKHAIPELKSNIHSEILLSRPQTKVWTTKKQLNLDMAGQRAGKSQMIGIQTGFYVGHYPKLKGFIGANTYLQLTQSTLVKTTEIWRDLYGFTEYNSKYNPTGHYVVDKTPPQHFLRTETFKEYHNIISFWNGHVIFVGSLDNYKAHEGKEFCYAHLDETKDTREEAVTTVILARLSQQGLYIDGGEKEILYIPDYKRRYEEIQARGLKSFNPCWIHTSPAIGQVDWLVSMFQLSDLEEEIRMTITNMLPNGKPDFFYKEIDNKSITIFSTYHNERNLPQNYIEGRKAILSENEQLKFIYGYPFSKTGGEYFPYFQRLAHVAPTPYIDGEPAHLTWDFNVMPYMTCVCAQVVFVDKFLDKTTGIKHLAYIAGTELLSVMQIRFYKEYCLASPNNTTIDVCRTFKNDNINHINAGIFYYGDASGRNRIEGLGSLTNFKMIERELAMYIHNSSNRVRLSNVNVLQRRDLMNRIFEGKYPAVEIVFDVNMVETIRDFEYLKLGENGKLKERVRDAQTGATYEKIGHTSDAVEYMVTELLKNLITD